MRVGRIARVVLEKSFGFIRADEFIDDVFFHFSAVDPQDKPDMWGQGQEVEFVLDDLLKINDKLLRATYVRGAMRPLTVTLSPASSPDLHSKHHPKARQRKPTWREPRKVDDDPKES
jgi:cold shock CspA family protein